MMLSDKSFEEFKVHIEFMRRTAWIMYHESADLKESSEWRGKQFAYETVLNELARRERQDAIPR